MEMKGEQRISAPQQEVWDALNDTVVLKDAIPGAELVEQTSETEMDVAATAKVGPVKARFKGKITLSDVNPPNSYTITGEGTGGAAGFAKGSAQVHLSEDGEGTLLRYAVSATVGGKIAQVGQRLIDQAANKMAGEFFTAFGEIVGGSPEPADESAPSGHTSSDDSIAPTDVPMLTKMPGAVSPAIWIAGLIAAVAVLMLAVSFGG